MSISICFTYGYVIFSSEDNLSVSVVYDPIKVVFPLRIHGLSRDHDAWAFSWTSGSAGKPKLNSRVDHPSIVRKVVGKLDFRFLRKAQFNLHQLMGEEVYDAVFSGLVCFLIETLYTSNSSSMIIIHEGHLNGQGS